jgi:hypothetical protein
VGHSLLALRLPSLSSAATGIPAGRRADRGRKAGRKMVVEAATFANVISSPARARDAAKADRIDETADTALHRTPLGFARHEVFAHDETDQQIAE